MIYPSLSGSFHAITEQEIYNTEYFTPKREFLSQKLHEFRTGSRLGVSIYDVCSGRGEEVPKKQT